MNTTGLRLRLHHFGISVADLEATLTWYTEKLGFERDSTYEIPGLQARVAFLRLGGFRVEVFEVPGAHPLPESAKSLPSALAVHGLKHVALAVDDLAAARAELERRGVEFVTDVGTVPNAHDERYTFFRDNNGLLIELYEPCDLERQDAGETGLTSPPGRPHSHGGRGEGAGGEHADPQPAPNEGAPA